jgi:hypothetical protein
MAYRAHHRCRRDRRRKPRLIRDIELAGAFRADADRVAAVTLSEPPHLLDLLHGFAALRRRCDGYLLALERPLLIGKVLSHAQDRAGSSTDHATRAGARGDLLQYIERTTSTYRFGGWSKLSVARTQGSAADRRRRDAAAAALRTRFRSRPTEWVIGANGVSLSSYPQERCRGSRHQIGRTIDFRGIWKLARNASNAPTAGNALVNRNSSDYGR